MDQFNLLRIWKMCVDHPVDILPLVVHSLLSTGHPVTFMQIGANDGIHDDPFRHLILKYNLPGILVEPQPRAFQQLLRNYEQQSNLIFENVAISANRGELEMYVFDREEENQISLDVFTSINRAHLERHKALLKLEANIEHITVPTATIDEILRKHHIHSVSVFIIDTEGYDFEVIKLIDLQKLCPMLIQFEHSNLTPALREECYRYLINAGYKLCAAMCDTSAVLP